MIMKIFNIRYIGYLIISLSVLWISCEEDQIEYDDSSAIPQEVADPFLQVVTGFVQLEQGTEKYGFTWNVINGADAVTSIKLYGNFNRPSTESASNEVMYGEYPVDSEFRTVQTDTLTFDDLIAGLTLEGGTMPASDADLLDGDGFAFRFEAVYASGRTTPIAGAMNMVFSKYAGLYEVSDSRYLRGTEDFGGWDGTQVFIGYVNATKLRYTDRWGYFAWAGCYFDLEFDADTKVVSVPVLGPCGLFAGVSALTCTDNYNNFNQLGDALGFQPCDDTNIIIDDDATGAHVIKLTYGYMGGNGLPRAMTEILTKVVD